MSVTGVALILFLTFHMSMNLVALFSGDAYNAVCEFLGANWYALVATLGLAALAVIHIVYAFLLTMQNRRARGDERYAVTSRPAKVEWASQNMLVLGIIVLLGLLLHLFNFWYNMMFAELTGIAVPHLPSDGFAYIVDTFACPVYVVLYIVWLERQGLVQPLEGHRPGVHHAAHAWFLSSSAGVRLRMRAQPVVILNS